ncbi:MAG: hypothetical protein D6785_04345 [Planctomycetota bacterium]|nr:MAG: hypothetical protein D6785_04345 [Planctomycetota bacterium]
MIFLLQDILGSYAQDEKSNLQFLLEFETFLADLHRLMAQSHYQAPQKTWEKLQKWWELNETQIPHVMDMGFIKKLMEKNRISEEAQEFWQLWWAKNKKPLESYFTSSYLQQIKASEKNLEESLESLPQKRTGIMASTQHKQLKKLQKTWKKIWTKVQKQPLYSFAEELEKANIRMQMNHLLEALQYLNRCATLRVYQKRRSPLTQKVRRILESIEQKGRIIQDEPMSPYHRFLILLIQGILKEISLAPKEALKMMEDEIVLEGLPQEWWFLVFYYRDQLLARLYYRKKRWFQAFLHISHSIDMCQNILILRHMKLFMNGGQNWTEPVFLPHLGDDLFHIYQLSYKILEAWKDKKKKKTVRGKQRKALS